MTDRSEKNPPSRNSKLTAQLEVALGRLAVAAHRRPHVTLIIALAAIAISLGFSRKLRLDTDLTALLPASFQSIQDIQSLEERFGGMGYVCVVGMGAEPEALERFAEDVAPLLEALPSIRYVDFKRPTKFFEDHLLYFLDLEDLKTVEERLRARLEYERLQNNPMMIDLEGAVPPSLEFADLREKYTQRSDQRFLRTQMGETYYVDHASRMITIQARPKNRASNLEVTIEVVQQVRDLIAGMDLTPYGPDFQVGFAGRHTKMVDQRALIDRDLKVASLVGCLLVLLYLWWHFRRLFAVLLVILPLGFGLAWSLGMAGVLYGSLNVLTAFIGVILLGLGIDHGIHLLDRYASERAVGAASEEATRSTFSNTGRAVAIAAATTTVGFAGLGLSEFRAFREFGVLGALGMVFVALAYMTVLPALLGLATRKAWRPPTRDARSSSLISRALSRFALLIVSLCAVASVTVGLQARNLEFNYNFDSLAASDLPSFRLDDRVNEMMGFWQVPVAVLTASMEDERYVAAALRQRQTKLGQASTVDFVASSAELVPLQQQKKRSVISAIGKHLNRVRSSWLEPEQRAQFALLKRMTRAEPFGRRDLPLEVRRLMQGPTGIQEAGFLLIFPAIRLADGEKVRLFGREVRDLPLPNGGTVSAAGEDMVLVDILEMVTSEGPHILLLTILLIIGTVLILTGSGRDTLLCLAPAMFTVVGTLGLMALTHQKLNYLNLILIPVLFGIGVDGGSHLVIRLRAGVRIHRVIDETGRAISGAMLTTALGFGSLLLADHSGLNSLGRMALLGIGVNIVACLVALPAFLAWRPLGNAGRRLILPCLVAVMVVSSPAAAQSINDPSSSDSVETVEKPAPRVELLVDGEAIFQRILHRVRTARHSIRINIFIWRDDATGRLIARELLAAAERGVEIDIRKDRLGAIFERAEENKQSFFHKEQPAKLWFQQQAIDWMYKAPREAWSGGHWPNALGTRILSHKNIRVQKDEVLRDHSKFYVFDEKILILGGTNIEDRALTEDAWEQSWSDYMVEVRGADIVQQFYRRLRGSGRNADPAPVSFIVHRPPEQIELPGALLSELSNAKEEVLIEMAYLGSPAIADELVELTNSGVRVAMLLPKRANVQNDLNYEVSRDLLQRTNGRIEIYMYPQMMHAKMFVVDRQTLVLGSANFQRRTSQDTSEASIVVRGDQLCIDEVIGAIEKHLSISHRVTAAKDVEYNRLRAFLEGQIRSGSSPIRLVLFFQQLLLQTIIRKFYPLASLLIVGAGALLALTPILISGWRARHAV